MVQPYMCIFPTESTLLFAVQRIHGSSCLHWQVAPKKSNTPWLLCFRRIDGIVSKVIQNRYIEIQKPGYGFLFVSYNINVRIRYFDENEK